MSFGLPRSTSLLFVFPMAMLRQSGVACLRFSSGLLTAHHLSR
ncbi:unnamed protein product [Amoebophrya sp. A25]|nr:unnamed protein product [Amoebophrya sp. A25]|eukprot:GSA25T00011414001.1